MRSHLPRSVSLVLKIGISAAGLAYAFWNLDIGEIATYGIKWTYIGLAVLMAFVSVVLLGYRWRVLISDDSLRAATLVRGQLIGFFGNNVFPFRAGEFLKTHYVFTRTSKRLMALAGSVIVERSLDVLVVLAIAIYVIAMHPRLESIVSNAELAIVISAIVLCGIALMIGDRFYRDILPSRIRRPLHELTGALTDYRAVALGGGMSLLLFASYAVRFQFVLLAMDVPISLSLLGLLLVATAAGFLIPAAPGAIGTYHAAVVYVLVSVHGLEATAAQICAIYLHLTAYLPTTVAGFVIYIVSGSRGARQRPKNRTHLFLSTADDALR